MTPSPYRLPPGPRIAARLVKRLRAPACPHPYRCSCCGGRHPVNRCPHARVCRRCGADLVPSCDLAVLTCRAPDCVRAMHAGVHGGARC